MRFLRRSSAFTLTELITVITILAILGTIAFTSLGKYSSSARDSQRVTDIKNVTKALSVYQIESSSLPEASWATITYSWWVVWTQGTLSDDIIRTIRGINKKPVDPLYGVEYTYSLTADKKEYQLAGIYESDALSFSPVPIAYAADTVHALVDGNYNGLITPTRTGSECSILALPSILLADISITELKDMTNSVLVFNKRQNAPFSYANKNLTMTGGFMFNPAAVSISVYSGSISLDTCKPSNQTEAASLYHNIQQAYSGTSLGTESPYRDILAQTGVALKVDAVSLVNHRFKRAIPLPTPEASAAAPSCNPGPSNAWLLTIGSDAWAANTLNGESARLGGLRNMTVDAADNIYITTGRAIKKYSNSWQFLMQIGGASGNNNLDGTSATFGSIGGIVVNSAGEIYVADSTHNRVKKYSSTGTYLLSIGSTTGASGNNNLDGTAARFLMPDILALDSSGNLYVSDFNVRNRKYTSAGNYIETLNVGGGTIHATRSSFVYSIDSSGDISVHSSTGVLSQFISDGRAWYLTVDTSGNIYASAGGIESSAYIYDGSGNFLRRIGWGDGSFDNAWTDTNDGGVCAGISDAIGIAVDSLWHIYVGDRETGTHFKVKKYGN